MTESRLLGLAPLKTEGGSALFDPSGPVPRRLSAEEIFERGRGLTMRRGDAREGLRWYVVRDKSCSAHIRDEEANVWTLSHDPDEAGWETDSGYGYGMTYADAREVADAANERYLRGK